MLSDVYCCPCIVNKIDAVLPRLGLGTRRLLSSTHMTTIKFYKIVTLKMLNYNMYEGLVYRVWVILKSVYRRSPSFLCCTNQIPYTLYRHGIIRVFCPAAFVHISKKNALGVQK